MFKTIPVEIDIHIKQYLNDVDRMMYDAVKTIPYSVSRVHRMILDEELLYTRILEYHKYQWQDNKPPLGSTLAKRSICATHFIKLSYLQAPGWFQSHSDHTHVYYQINNHYVHKLLK